MKSELGIIHLKWQPKPSDNLVKSEPVKKGEKLYNIEQMGVFSLRRNYSPDKLRNLSRRCNKFSIKLECERKE